MKNPAHNSVEINRVGKMRIAVAEELMTWAGITAIAEGRLILWQARKPMLGGCMI